MATLPMFIFEVAFTGSTEVGHIVQKAAGKRFKSYLIFLSSQNYFLFTDLKETGLLDT
jgi:acyl-CoA reductase-like NAD-dependent aldehyde dehydrogenase